ncbi:MAG TPA: DinB family protein [Chitinophagaceae bacterium]|nr:DinB family protein [Chitinophagaceae bacterium]
MLKRTQGRLLLTLLVITGLAGTLNNTSLSFQERKNAINLVKDGRKELTDAVGGLSDAQLNFKTTSDSWSIKQCIYHIASSEKNSWNLLAAIMKAAPNPEKRSLITLTDEQLIAMMENPSSNFIATESADTKNISFKSINEALDSYRLQSAELIKYLKLSTEDLRDHVVQMPFGWIDCYQLCLMIGSHSIRHIIQIEELRSNPKFPSR